jgi:glycosyltransferase involved in cell wall biosynthesis
VLPTVVDPGHYQVKSHSSTETPTLVWIGSKSTLLYLRQFAGMLEESARRVAGLKLITIADVPLENAPLPVEHVPWSVETESAALCRGDIGIAPTPVDEWTLGKCGFKIVQYMAAGLPVIASPVGANREIVVEGVTGLLPNNSGEWADAIAKLAGDAAKRGAMGTAGRMRAEQNFSIERAADVWAGLLEGISAL